MVWSTWLWICDRSSGVRLPRGTCKAASSSAVSKSAPIYRRAPCTGPRPRPAWSKAPSGSCSIPAALSSACTPATRSQNHLASPTVATIGAITPKDLDDILDYIEGVAQSFVVFELSESPAALRQFAVPPPSVQQPRNSVMGQ